MQGREHKPQHFLLMCCPAQGHINPTLILATVLLRAGAQVTFATTVHGLRSIKSHSSIPGLSYASFSDGFDDGNKPIHDPHHIMAEFKRVGSQTLAKLLGEVDADGRPVTFVIYNLLLPWAALVAREHGVPSAFLCTHSASAFAIYHRFFNGGKTNLGTLPDSIELEGLPRFECGDLPSFLLPTSPYASIVPTFVEHIRVLEQDPNPCVLLNSFDSLERNAIKAVGNMNLIPIGPLIDPNPCANSLKCELFEQSKDYLQWLNSKPDRSVIYVSFGTMAVPPRKQIQEILRGLLESRRPFMWVIREAEDVIAAEAKAKEEEEEEVMLIVPWCSQAEVLGHRALGSFVSHCGWNSTLEGVVAGLPVVACPQIADQMTNAKLVAEVWRVGVRARASGDDGVVERGELKRCVEMVMEGGERREELRKNCKKWKGLAMEALEEGSGSSYKNLQLLVQGIQNS